MTKDKQVKTIIRVFINNRNKQAFSLTRHISDFTDYIDLLQELRNKLAHELRVRGILKIGEQT